MTTTTSVPSCLPAGAGFLADATTLPTDRLLDADDTGAAMLASARLFVRIIEIPSDEQASLANEVKLQRS
jgi:hypothetical protein